MSVMLERNTESALDLLPGLPGLVGRFSPVGVWLPESTPKEDALCNLTRLIPLVNEAGPFWIGDTAVFLKEVHGMECEAIALAVQKPVSTLKKYSRLARAFDECRRRHFLETLSLSHMLEVLVFKTPEEQDHHLEQAALNGWPVKQLRKEIAKVVKPFDEEEETLPVSVGQAEGEPDMDEPPAMLREFMAERAAPEKPVPLEPGAIYVDAETMEALRRSQSNPLLNGTVRPPVFLPEENCKGLWVATHIVRNLDTGVDTAVCARVSEAAFYQSHWEQEALPEPLRLEAWKEAHPEGEGGLAGLLVLANMGDGYVFLGETATFIHHARQEAESGKVSNNGANMSKSGPEISTSAGHAEAADISPAPESAPDWQEEALRALMEAKAALLRAHDVTPEEAREEMGAALYLNAVEPVHAWMEALQAQMEQTEAEESENE